MAAGEDAHDAGASLDLGVEPLQRIGRLALQAMRCGKGHVRQDVGLVLVHERTDLREALSELIGDRTLRSRWRGLETWRGRNAGTLATERSSSRESKPRPTPTRQSSPRPLIAGWPCGHWKPPPLHGARQHRMFSRSVRNGRKATNKAEPAPCLSGGKPEMRLLCAYERATSLRLSCIRPQPPHLLHSQPRLVAAWALYL